MAWLGLSQPLNSSRHAWSSAAGAADGSTASTRGSPKIWPIDGGVSRGSSLRKTSKRGSTCSISGASGAVIDERLLGAVQVHDLLHDALDRLHDDRHVDRERRAALRLAEHTLDAVSGHGVRHTTGRIETGVANPTDHDVRHRQDGRARTAHPVREEPA